MLYILLTVLRIFFLLKGGIPMLDCQGISTGNRCAFLCWSRRISFWKYVFGLKQIETDWLIYISETGKCCYSEWVAPGDSQDETLSTECINTNNTFQTNKVSHIFVEPDITMFSTSIPWNFLIFLTSLFEICGWIF